MKVVVGLEAETKEPPAPLIIDQVPVPEVGVLAAKTAEVTPQRFIWSEPAVAIVGLALKVIVTSSELGEQGALDIVHLNT